MTLGVDRLYVTDYCHPLSRLTYWRGRPVGPVSQERRVVGAVIGTLIDLGHDPFSIQLEYRLSPGNRVDVAIPYPDAPILVECKAVRIDGSAVRQGIRYLIAARLRWPGATPRVVLAAPDIDETIPLPEGLTAIRMEPA